MKQFLGLLGISIFLTPPDCQKNTHSNQYGSISFGQFFGVSNQNIQWVPHSLSSSQKQARLEMSQDLLQVLRSAKHHAWKYIVTLDEAWFHFSKHFDRIWLSHDELPSSFPKQKIAHQNLMITVIGNSHGFHVI
jgi:hypothetical protein